MVMRTIEIKEISFEVQKYRQKEVVDKLKELYGDQLEIKQENDIITVSGDLRNYKRRNRILYILSCGEHGEDI